MRSISHVIAASTLRPPRAAAVPSAKATKRARARRKKTDQHALRQACDRAYQHVVAETVGAEQRISRTKAKANARPYGLHRLWHERHAQHRHRGTRMAAAATDVTNTRRRDGMRQLDGQWMIGRLIAAGEAWAAHAAAPFVEVLDRTGRPLPDARVNPPYKTFASRFPPNTMAADTSAMPTSSGASPPSSAVTAA